MKKSITLVALALAALGASPALSESRRGPQAVNFASDTVIVPVMANNPGLQNAIFATHVSIMNPTAQPFDVSVSLWNGAGDRQDRTIRLGAGELKLYDNFLGTVFDYVGAGTVKFRSPGGDNLFVVSSEVYTAGQLDRFGTTVPALDFAGSDSRSFAAGVQVDETFRTNIGCFNESASSNTIHAIVRDDTGALVTTFDLDLAGNAWGQKAVPANVSGGYVTFEPSAPADCYAVVVHNRTNDGRFILGVEYEP